MLALCALLFSGVVFGAFYYIAVVQISALKEIQGYPVRAFFQALQKHASSFNLSLSFIAGVSGLVCWFQYNQFLWIVGAALLFCIIIVEIYFLSPLEKKILVYSDNENVNQIYIRHWVMWHWVRVALAGSAFIVFIYNLAY